MNLETKSKIALWVVIASLLGCIFGLVAGSINVAILCLLAFCLSSSVLVMLNFAQTILNLNTELSRLKAVSDLLREGKFDEVLDIPDEVLR